MPAPSPETNTDVHPSDTHRYNACLKHIHKDIHTHAPHAHLDVCVWSPQTYPHSYTHNQPSNKHTLQTQANPCVHSLKTWMPIHIPLKHRQTDRQTDTHTQIDAHALCLLFRAAPVTFPSTPVHSQLLLLDLKMWGYLMVCIPIDFSNKHTIQGATAPCGFFAPKVNQGSLTSLSLWVQ